MENKKSLKPIIQDEFTPVSQFKFLQPFEEDFTNGLFLSSYNIYLPDEITENILSYVPVKDLLGLTLVCKKWCNIIKSESFWISIYNRHYPGKAKKLPWYVFYCYFTTKNFENLLKNGNGQEQFKYWTITKNFGSKFIIEDPPCGSDPLPTGVPEFNGHTSCFATSYQACAKLQIIPLGDKRLLLYILNKFKPHIYISEWVAGRFDCGCFYNLSFTALCRNDSTSHIKSLESGTTADTSTDATLHPLFNKSKNHFIEQWQGKVWEKVEILVEELPPNVESLIFEHEGRDTQFWLGHYGSKMAGGVVKVVFDSIKPLEDEEALSSNFCENSDQEM